MNHTRVHLAVAAAAISVFVLAGCGDASTSPAHWSYEGEEGPERWGELDPSYALCAEGSAQTPIDIVNPLPAELADPEFAYEAGTAGVENTGHTIQANATPGSVLRFGGEEYPLAQMHFHAPSEHTIEGVRSPVEVHFVHKTEDDRISVIGVQLTAVESPNEAWRPFIDALTVEEAETVEASVDWRAMLPADPSTIRYSGSLTTPPCTEGVSWLLMQQPVAVSAEQIEAFETAYSGNNRPLQPLNDRVVQADAAGR
jgi:carbonic anhydrase